MKKIVLSFCLVVITGIFGYSQMHLTLSDSIGNIPNDTTIVRTGSDTLIEIESYFAVKNNASTAMLVRVRKVELSLVDTSQNYFCWGACYGFGTYLSVDSVEIRSGAINYLDFSGHYLPNRSVGYSIIRYVFFDQANRSDSVCVNVKYDTRPLEVDNKILINSNLTAYPNPADNTATFVYRLAEGSDATVLVRNILGSVVKEVSLSGRDGKISVNTSDLANGIYFYSLVENGISVGTKKLIVKH
jgi:hypothetical protein